MQSTAVPAPYPRLEALLPLVSRDSDSRWIVVTDLDGTLLGHHDYDAAPALATLRRLAAARIPVVFATSKTRRETETVRNRLGNTDPFVVENGAAILLPAAAVDACPAGWVERAGYFVLELAISRSRVLEALDDLARRFRFTGFRDHDRQSLARLTGLDAEQAALALDREYGEPIEWRDSPAALDRFIDELTADEFTVTRGGRFLHVGGATDKGRATTALREALSVSWRTDVRVLALGDGDNDATMLEAADLGVVVPSPVNPPPRVAADRVAIADRPGPPGWAHAVEEFLDHLRPGAG